MLSLGRVDGVHLKFLLRVPVPVGRGGAETKWLCTSREGRDDDEIGILVIIKSQKVISFKIQTNENNRFR